MVILNSVGVSHAAAFLLFYISGVRPQQGLVCQLFCLLYLQYQAYSQVSIVHKSKTQMVTENHCGWIKPRIKT